MCILYTARAACGKNAGRRENIRAVRKVKKGKMREGINVGGGNVLYILIHRVTSLPRRSACPEVTFSVVWP
jgi:hypothetical protein